MPALFDFFREAEFLLTPNEFYSLTLAAGEAVVF